MSESRAPDVVVVGAGIAGCATAVQFARRGLQVCLLERAPDPGAWKRTCTHLLQCSALPAIERLGVLQEILDAGAARIWPEMWTQWGWITPPPPDRSEPGYDLNLRRSRLDPILRSLVARTPGVEFLPGHTVEGLLCGARGRVAGVVARGPQGRRVRIDARLTVGADGRSSKVAAARGARTWRTDNGRSSFWAYFEHVRLPRPDRFRVWFLGEEFAAVFPTDSGQTLLAYMPLRSRAAAFKRDLERNLLDAMQRLPDGPSLARATRVSPYAGRVDIPSTWRVAGGRGAAFVGDAALTTDPLSGVGCGWAFQSAEWLVEATAPALAGGADLERCLRRYGSAHAKRLGGYHVANCSYSKARQWSPPERLIMSAATRDEAMAARVAAFGSKSMPLLEFAGPASLARALAVNVRHAASQRLAAAVGGLQSAE